jgi:hypothetical protein
MKKIIRLTERDLVKLIKSILVEQSDIESDIESDIDSNVKTDNFEGGIPKVCPKCKSPNSKMYRCQWCGYNFIDSSVKQEINQKLDYNDILQMIESVVPNEDLVLLKELLGSNFNEYIKRIAELSYILEKYTGINKKNIEIGVKQNFRAYFSDFSFNISYDKVKKSCIDYFGDETSGDNSPFSIDVFNFDSEKGHFYNKVRTKLHVLFRDDVFDDFISYVTNLTTKLNNVESKKSNSNEYLVAKTLIPITIIAIRELINRIIENDFSK